MYNVTSASAAWNFLTGQNSGVNGADGSFADIFGASLKGVSASGGKGATSIDDMLAKLSERFPNATVKEASTGKGKDAAEKTFGKEEGDNVAVDSSTLANMIGNSDIFKQVEDALSAFFNSDAGSNAAQGTYTQRNVSISVTFVSFQVAQRDSGTGDLLSSQDLQSTLHEKLKDLVSRVFGVGSSNKTEDEESEESEETEETTAAEETKNTTNQWSNGSGYFSAWSMQMFYSSSFIQSMGEQSNQNASMQSFQFSASYQSFSGNLQNFANSYLPQSMYSQLNQGSSLGGPFTSLLENGLGQLGMTSGGFSQTTEGYLFNFRNGRDFLSEWLNMAGMSNKPSTGTTTEEEAEVAAEAQVEEEAAVQ